MKWADGRYYKGKWEMGKPINTENIIQPII